MAAVIQCLRRAEQNISKTDAFAYRHDPREFRPNATCIAEERPRPQHCASKEAVSRVDSEIFIAILPL